MTNPALTATLTAYAAIPGIALAVADSLVTLSAAQSALATLLGQFPRLGTVMTDTEMLSAAQLAALPALPGLTVAPGAALILSDSVEHLLALPTAAVSHVTLTFLSQDDTASVAQLGALVALPGFTPGHALTACDTLAHLAALTTTEQQVISGIVVRDTMANLLAAPALPPGTTGITVLLDDNLYTVAEATALLAAGTTVTLAPDTGSTLRIADTSFNIAAAGGLLAALRTDGPISVTATDLPPVLTALEAASLPAVAPGLEVADTGAALSAVADQIFGRGFASITVTSGTFTGTAEQLLDPTLHYGSSTIDPVAAILSSSAVTSAQLTGTAVVDTAHLTALSVLPGFSVAPGASVTVTDTLSALIGASGLVKAYATSVQGTSSETLTAADATALASIRAAIGASHFSLGGHVLTINDDAANIANTANAAGIALAGSATLSTASIIDAAGATTLLGLGSTFTPGSVGLIVTDTVANLNTLAGSAATLNSWGAHLQLSTDATVPVAAVLPLLLFSHFAVGSYQLTIADTAAALLAAPGGALRLAGTTQLSRDEILTASAATALTSLPGYISGGHALTIVDTPAHLATLPAAVAAFATTETIAPRTVANTAEFTITADQIGHLQGLPNLSLSGFTDRIAVVDSAANLAALAPDLMTAGPGSLLAHVVPTLGADAVVSASTANTLAQLPAFSLGGHSLHVLDTPVTLLSGGVAGGIAIATSTGLDSAATLTAASATALAAVHGFAADGNPLTIADTPAQLLTLPSAVSALAVHLAILPYTADQATEFTLNAAQFATLATLPNLSWSGPITVADNASALATLAASFSTAAPGSTLLAARAASTFALSTDSAGTAATMALLIGLPGFSTGGHALALIDTPSALLAAPAAELALTTSVTLAAHVGPWPVTAATATALAALPHFNAGPGLAIVDDAGNLLAPGNAEGLAAAASDSLSAATTLTVAAAAALIGQPGFQTNPGAPVVIADTLGHLLRLGSMTLSANDALLRTTPIGLSDDAVATVAQLHALAALPQYDLPGHGFTLNGLTLTLSDSGRHLASYTSDGVVTPTAYVLAGDATFTAAQAVALASRGLDTGDNVVTVADTPAALLDPANASGLGMATVLSLAGDATATAAQAAALFSDPHFSTGGHQLTVVDTAAALLGLNSTVDTLATTLALAGSETVDVATVLGLTAFGIKFSLRGQSLTVADTAANLTTLNTLETRLASAEILSADASVNAATAELLAALPAFSRAPGVDLTITDSFTALTALPASVLAIATRISLPSGTPVTLTVAQALSLAAMPGFSNTGTAVTVMDTIAHLASPGWQGIATAYAVTDSIANLTTNAANPLLTGAETVTLLGDSVTDTTTIDILAGLPHFSRGSAALVVADSPDAIAAHATDILAVATAARIIASTPISAAQATDLALLATAGALTFAGSNHLVLADSFAHLSDPAFASGVSLASVITITDTADNLLAAAAYDWGSIAPFYALSAGGSISGAEAAVFAGLGSHFMTGGFVLVMEDTAALVTDNAAALTELGIDARVTDTIAGIDAAMSGLLALGARLLSITPTDTIPVSAGAAAGLQPLSHILNGIPIAVADSAAAVVAHSADLLALGTHLGAITLTDALPVTVDVATGLLPFLASLAAGPTLDVEDTAAAIAAQSAGLATLGIHLGTITLSDGTTTNAATAAALLPIDSHLGLGVQLSVSDSVTAITDAASALTSLAADGRVAAITAPLASVTSIITQRTTLAALGVSATIADTAAHVNAALDGLEAAATLLTNITLTDTGTPNITLSLTQLVNDTAVLALITSPHTTTVSDTAAMLSADLAGVSSVILTHLAAIDSITASDSGTIILTADDVLKTGVDDGAASALAKIASGSLVVIGVDVARVGAIAGLPVPPAHMTVMDTAAHIEADLTSGGSILTAERSLITAITISDGAQIHLSSAQILTTGVDDGTGSVLSLLHGGSVAVTDITVGEIAAIAGLAVAPSVITIRDTAAHIQADLSNGGSQILSHLAAISTITVSDGGTIMLTVPQIEAVGVDDGPGSALALMTGGFLGISHATVADLPTLGRLSVVPEQVAIVDTVADIAADLALGSESAILGGLELISTITISPADVLSLTAATLLHAGVDDGPASALAKMNGATITATEVAIADIDTVFGLFTPPSRIEISDTAAAITADLTSGHSGLAAHSGAIGGITVSDGGTILLGVTDVTAPHIDDGAGSVLSLLTGGTVTVTGAAVADIPALLALAVQPTLIMIQDSAAAVLNDLGSGASVLVSHIAAIGGIVLTDPGVPALSISITDLITDSPVLHRITSPYTITVSDTAANIQADLTSGASDLVGLRAAISAIIVTDAGTITLTQAQVLAAHVNDGAGSVFGLLTGGDLMVTGVAVAAIATVIALPFQPGIIAVSDTAAALEADLISASSAIQAYAGWIATLNVSDGGVVHLTDDQIMRAGMDDGSSALLNRLAGGSLVVTDVPIADIATILGLGVAPSSIVVRDTAVNIEADLVGGSSALTTHYTSISAITVADGGTVHLTVAQIEAVLVDDGVSSILAKMTGGRVTVTDAAVADIGTLVSLGVAPDDIEIHDTAARIQAALALSPSPLVSHIGSIGTITVSDSGLISLTASELLRAGVDDGPGSVLEKISGGVLAVTQVQVSDLRSIGALAVVPSAIAVSDTAAHIQADLASGSSIILAYLGAISTIAVAPAGTIALTEAQVLAASVDDFGGSALAKMTGLTLIISDVPVVDINTVLGLGVAPDNIVVADTAANIQADIAGGASAILAHSGVISGIIVSDAGTITLTTAQIEASHIDDGPGSVLARMTGGTIAVSDAAVSDLSTLALLGVPPALIGVTDTAAAIQSDLGSGASSLLAHVGLISEITVSDGGTITLTANDILVPGVDDGAGAVLAKMAGGALVVTNVATGNLNAVAALWITPTTISMSDTAAHIQADLRAGTSAILDHLGLIGGIAVNPAGVISLTESEILRSGVDDGPGSALAKMSGATLTVTDVSIADIGVIAGLGVAPTTINVSDTAAMVEADLTSGASVIVANLGHLGAGSISDGGALTLTVGQIEAMHIDDGPGSALSLFANGTPPTITVTGATVADLPTLMALAVPPTHVIVADTIANLVAGASTIIGYAGSIPQVSPTDLTTDVAAATQLYNALHDFVTIDQHSLSITDTAAHLLAANPSVLTAAGAVVMSDQPTGLTAAEATSLSDLLGGHLLPGYTLGIADTAAHLLDPANAAGVALATSITLSAGILSSAAYVTTLSHLPFFHTGGSTIAIQDTVPNLLNPDFADGLAIATAVTPAGNQTVPAADLAALTAIPAFSRGPWSLIVSDTIANILALSSTALAAASLIAVVDTAATVSANLNSLQTTIIGEGHPLTITLSDAVNGTPAIIVTAATYMADTATLDALQHTGVIQVIGTAAQIATMAGSLAGDVVVADVSVTDSAANVLANLTALVSIGGKFDSVTLTDTTLNATWISSLLTVPHLNATGFTISDTGTQIATAIQANGAAGLAFLNAHTVALSADSVVTASQALSLEALTNLQKNGHTLSAWDTASHLIDSIDGYLAAVSAPLIDAVYLKTISGSATVSASTAAALFAIPRFSKNNPNGTGNVLIVQDTAAHLESAFAALNTHASAIDHVVVSANATVTDAVFGDLLTLGATAALGVAITVRDTAANLIAHAPAQLAGAPSLIPGVWALSGSATVTVPGAAFLGGLSGFTPGIATLTLGADGSASVAEANNLASLGATLRLAGHHVHVAGSVAAVSGLSSAARAIVTPDITDTFAHVAALSLGSGLLGGTITITDSEAPSVAQANAFLALLKVGAGTGIPAANVSFGGNTEAITDTLAHIQTLTGSAGWTSNPAVQANFTLIVADTVAHLIDPTNTGALAAMAGTTLSADQTVSAASAEALFGLQATINFGLGGHTITIQDTAANLLDSANGDGETLASVWQLSGNDTVAAADAETLLSEVKFNLNHTLTVSDSSDNLLDGVLAATISGSPYAANVHVTLAGPEVLDAQTAAALVSLPGYTNTGALSIQDSSDYLLNPGNHTAEADATSVTLIGDETVSAATAYHLAGVPNFTLGSNHLTLASDDYADAATLAALGDFDTGFDTAGHSLTMTQNALALSPGEYTALLSDNVVLNGHALAALATGVTVTSAAGSVHVAGNGIDGATLNVYAASGTALSTTPGVTSAFTATASEAAIGNGVVVTETVGASAITSESAPIIALERSVLTGAATADGVTFAASGAVQVDVGTYIDLYSATTAPVAPAHPVLIYDVVAHTLSLDVAGHMPLVLVTLGTATTPDTLDPSEIYIRHFV